MNGLQWITYWTSFAPGIGKTRTILARIIKETAEGIIVKTNDGFKLPITHDRIIEC